MCTHGIQAWHVLSVECIRIGRLSAGRAAGEILMPVCDMKHDLRDRVSTRRGAPRRLFSGQAVDGLPPRSPPNTLVEGLIPPFDEFDVIHNGTIVPPGVGSTELRGIGGWGGAGSAQAARAAFR